jgi:hypothetical protein
MAAAALVLVLALAAAALYVWLNGYAPLDARGGFAPGPGAATPAGGADGKPAFSTSAARRTLDVAFTVRNSGRFAVTLTGLEHSGTTGPEPVRLLVTDSATASTDPGHLHSFAKVRLGPGDSAILVARWSMGCGATDGVRVRYEYLSLFDNAETLTLPFAVTRRCGAAQKP